MASSPLIPATVFLDANVLYPAALRDFLMRLGLDGLLRIRWSNFVHEEWMKAVLRNFPDIGRSQVERIRDLMNLHSADSLVEGFEGRINSLTLPDANDRHVLAAAIHCEAEIILTRNLRDFPESILNDHGIKAQDPDDFLHRLFLDNPERLIAVARSHRSNLKNPPKSPSGYLDSLQKQGLIQTTAALVEHASKI